MPLPRDIYVCFNRAMKRHLKGEPRSNSRWLTLVAMATALVAIAVAIRFYAGQRAEEALIIPGGVNEATPADIGLSFTSFSVSSGDRALRAWLVKAPGTTAVASAVLVFHGNRTSVGDYVGMLETLHARDITAMVFDYSGFGESSGEATAKNLRQDAIAAFRVFADSVGPDTRKYLLGASLGSGVLLDALSEFEQEVDGVVLVGAFTSARDIAVRTTPLPRQLAVLVPDLFNSIKAVQNLHRPLLLIHSEEDELFPVTGAEAIVGAAAGPARLVRLQGVEHGAYLTSDAQWEPVISFMTTERIP